MSDYGFYIWTSYGAAALILLLNVLLPLRERKNLFRRLREFYRAKDGG